MLPASSDDLIADLGACRLERCRDRTVIPVDVIDQSHLHGASGWLPDHKVEKVSTV